MQMDNVKPFKRQWIDKEVVVEGKTIKLKRLIPVGHSLALVLPKVWLDFMCKQDSEGRYWVEIEVEGSVMKITGYKGEIL